MDKQKYNVNLAPGVTELIIREGSAQKITDPIPTKFEGLLTAPGEFFVKRKDALKDKKDSCRIEADFHAGIITFIVEEKSAFRDEIKGKLSVAKIIEDFHINSESGGLRSDKELAKFFRQNQFYFVDKDKHAAIVKALMAFSATITTIVDNHQDNRGNVKKLLDKKVEQEIPEKFIMKAPIYEGYPAIEFEVFICAEAGATDVKFYLESPELYRIQEEEKRRLINDELKPFIDFGCPVLQK